jgi:hypothetical protein
MKAWLGLTRECRPLFAVGCLAALLALQACVMVPRTIETYDPDCQFLRREMTLEMVNFNTHQGCGGDACAALLVAAGVVTAASVVVSGSVAVVGNMVYWFENKKRCARVVHVPAAG